MTTRTETINIVIRQDGARVVTRDISSIGDSAKDSAKEVNLLKGVLTALASGLLIQKVAQYADAWNNVTGQIAVSTKTHEEAIAVQEKLFQVSQKTRTGIEDITNLYQRNALAGASLGASQEQIIKFTEGIGKALVVQHTSSEQASGSLLQLGQLLGTGKVRAQEFNSVLENLPVVLKIVANNIKGANGDIATLRRIMGEGKLTSKEFFDAFLAGADDLDKDFDKSARTISQGVTVISNSLKKFVGEVDQSFGISNKFAKAAEFIAKNLDLIATSAEIAAVAVGTYFGAIKLGSITTAIAQQVDFIAKVASGKVVMLGSAEAATQMAFAEEQASLRAARAATAKAAEVAAAAHAQAIAEEAAVAASNAASLQKARSSATETAAKIADLEATRAAIVVSREEAVAKLAASQASIQSARSTLAAAEAHGLLNSAMSSVRNAHLELAAAQEAQSVTTRELAVLGQQQARVSVAITEATVAQAAATRALAAAQAASAATSSVAAAKTAETAVAATASAAAATNAARATGVLGATTGVLARTMAALGLGFLANPYVLLAAAVAGAIFYLYKFGDAIESGLGKTASLNDVFRALGSTIKESFQSAFNGASSIVTSFFEEYGSYLSFIGPNTKAAFSVVKQSFDNAFEGTGSGFAGVVTKVARTVDAIVGLLIGVAKAVTQTFGSGLHDLIVQGFLKAYNSVLIATEVFINSAISAYNVLARALGKEIIAPVKFELQTVDPNAVSSYGKGIADAFYEGFEVENGAAEKFVNKVFDRAKVDGLKRQATAEAEEIKKQINAVYAAADPVGEAYSQLSKQADLLAKAVTTVDESTGKSVISQEEYSKRMLALTNRYAEVFKTLDNLKKPLGKAVEIGPTEKEIEKQLKAIEKIKNEMRNLASSVDPVTGAYLELGHNADILAKALTTVDIVTGKTIITQKEHDAYMLAMIEHYKDTLDPLGAFYRSLADETTLLSFNSRERNVQAQYMQKVQELQRAGHPLNEQEKQDLLSQLSAYDELSRRIQLRDQLLANSVDARRDYSEQIKALQDLSNEPTSGFTAGDKAQKVASLIPPELVTNTQTAADAAVASYKLMLDRVTQLNKAHLISERDFSKAKIKIWMLEHDTQLQAADTALGGLSSLMQSKNREMFEIGKAAAIAQATISAGTAIMNAYATSPWYLGLALGISAAANLYSQIDQIRNTKIQGYEAGGFTGMAATNAVAGIVHGQEFVHDAQTTRRVGVSNLEALSNGTARIVSNNELSNSSGGASKRPNVAIEVKNLGPAMDFETESITEEKITLIARSQAKKVVQEDTPRLVTSQISSPNSPISKSMDRNFNVPRKR